MAIYAAVFSPTGTSRQGVWSIATALGDAVLLDVTCAPAESCTFSPEDLVVFGAPVYGGRVFQGALERLAPLQGNNTPCLVTVTSGNRDFDDALLELTDFCREHGFAPFAGAALVGEHTYGSVQKGRPNAHDLDQDRAFALEAWEDLQAGWTDFAPPGNRPYKEGGKGGSFVPTTTEDCIHCGLCVGQCPMQAIAPDCAAIDPEKCISCFRCVKGCPQHAKGVFTPAYESFAAAFSEKLKEPKENAYFLPRG